jgi:type VI secretion system protein ImpB
MPESIQQKLKRVRAPRVHLTYEVETEGARVVKELPFVMGVVADFSGNPTKPLQPLEDRKFIEVNRDNFDDVMKRMNPGLNMRVPNTIKGDNTEIPVELTFNSMSDFEPANVIRQVEPLQKLLEMRNRLRDLASKVDRSAELEGILEQVLQNTDDFKKLSSELGQAKEAGGSANPASDSESGPDSRKDS